MQFIDIPTEQTTAITDGILAIIAFSAVIYFKQISEKDDWKATLWIYFFCLLSIASALGAIAHGLRMPENTRDLLWYPLNLSLGLLIGIFMVAVLYDLLGEEKARRVLPIMVVISCLFFIITAIWSDSFLVFIIYEAVIMLFALGCYVWLSYTISFEGGWFMTGGILVSIIAAIFQTFDSLSLIIVWSFDHNGIYHLIQIVGILLLVTGIRKSLIF